MKLFKKLAAAALAAVLALSMVGCGAGSTGSGDITGAVKDYLADRIKMSYGITAEHKDELDTLAEKLIREANEASEANTAYFVSYAENYKPQSPITTEEQKISWMANQTMNYIQNVGKRASLSAVKALELGAGTVKIGDTEYIVVVAKSVETPAPGTTKD